MCNLCTAATNVISGFYVAVYIQLTHLRSHLSRLAINQDIHHLFLVDFSFAKDLLLRLLKPFALILPTQLSGKLEFIILCPIHESS